MSLDGVETPDVVSEFRRVRLGGAVAVLGGILLAAAIAAVLALAADGGEPDPKRILYPAFAMFFLVAAVLTRMGWLRVNAVLGGDVSMRFYCTFDEGDEPEALRVVTRNFINLFEMPVLFYVAVLMAYVTAQVSHWLVGLAWAYVALRVGHPSIQLSSNDVVLRLSAYAASGIVLLVLWGTLLAKLWNAA